MSDGEASFDASICKKASDVSHKRKRDEEEEKRAQQVEEFFAEFKKNARIACSEGLYNTTVSLKEPVTEYLHTGISQLLCEKKFAHHWYSNHGETTYFIWWGSPLMEKR